MSQKRCHTQSVFINHLLKALVHIFLFGSWQIHLKSHLEQEECLHTLPIEQKVHRSNLAAKPAGTHHFCSLIQRKCKLRSYRQWRKRSRVLKRMAFKSFFLAPRKWQTYGKDKHAHADKDTMQKHTRGYTDAGQHTQTKQKTTNTESESCLCVAHRRFHSVCVCVFVCALVLLML